VQSHVRYECTEPLRMTADSQCLYQRLYQAVAAKMNPRLLETQVLIPWKAPHASAGIALGSPLLIRYMHVLSLHCRLSK
jgi:hypothetical protein